MNKEIESRINDLFYNNLEKITVWFYASQTNYLKIFKPLLLCLDVTTGDLKILREWNEESGLVPLDVYRDTMEDRKRIAGEDFTYFFTRIKNVYFQTFSKYIN